MIEGKDKKDDRPPDRKKSRKRFWLIGGLVVLFVGAGIAGFFLPDFTSAPTTLMCTVTKSQLRRK